MNPGLRRWLNSSRRHELEEEPPLPLGWVRKRATLKFYLGEACLYRWSFGTLGLDTYLTRLRLDSPSLTLPFDALSDGVEALVLRSHPVRSKLARFQITRQAIQYVPSQYQRYSIELKGTFEDYLKRYSSKSRWTLRKKVHRFAQLSGGSIDWREFSSQWEIPEFHALARNVSERTYQARLLGAGIPDNPIFLQQLLTLAAQDSFKGYVLFVSGKPVAYVSCPIVDGKLIYQYVGYDPEYAVWSPGIVLQYLILERLFAEQKYSLFDFTEGEGPHKEFFATQSISCADVYYFRKTLRNAVLLTMHSAASALSVCAVELLDRMGLKTSVKHRLRKVLPRILDLRGPK